MLSVLEPCSKQCVAVEARPCAMASFMCTPCAIHVRIDLDDCDCSAALGGTCMRCKDCPQTRRRILAEASGLIVMSVPRQSYSLADVCETSPKLGRARAWWSCLYAYMCASRNDRRVPSQVGAAPPQETVPWLVRPMHAHAVCYMVPNAPTIQCDGKSTLGVICTKRTAGQRRFPCQYAPSLPHLVSSLYAERTRRSSLRIPTPLNATPHLTSPHLDSLAVAHLKTARRWEQAAAAMDRSTPAPPSDRAVHIASEFTIISTLLLAIATLLFAARLWTRCFPVFRMLADDYVSLVGYVRSLHTSTVCLLTLDVDPRRHQHISLLQKRRLGISFFEWRPIQVHSR
jgi:hypothetical protein